MTCLPTLSARTYVPSYRLRNRLEHRHAHSDEALTVNLAGHSHALLINYENEITAEFGAGPSMALRLRIPVFVGTLSRRANAPSSSGRPSQRASTDSSPTTSPSSTKRRGSYAVLPVRVGGLPSH